MRVAGQRPTRCGTLGGKGKRLSHSRGVCYFWVPRMATGIPFGSRADRAAQTQVLGAALAAISPSRPVAAFDLDSTILVNKVRQARIVREFGTLRGDRRLEGCQPEAVISWDLRDTLRLCGAAAAEIAAMVPELRGF